MRGISREALRLLAGHEWRGNVRELSNAIERAHILAAIEQCGGNKRQAAKRLGIGATSLYRKLGDPVTDDAEPA